MLWKGIPRVVIVVVASAAAALLSPALQAQRPSPGQPELYRMALITVKSGMMPQFTELQTSEYNPALKKGGLTQRSVYTSGVFGDPDKFASFSPIKDLADLDNPTPLVKALGEPGAAALIARASGMVESQRVMLIRTRPDLSYIPDPKAPPAPLALVSEVEVVAGRRSDFEMAIKKEVTPVMQQAKVRSYSVLEVVAGGNIGTYFTSIGYDSYAAIGKGHPFEVVLGPGGSAKIEAKFVGIVKNLQRSVVRHRPEMSFMTATGTSN